MQKIFVNLLKAFDSIVRSHICNIIMLYNLFKTVPGQKVGDRLYFISLNN